MDILTKEKDSKSSPFFVEKLSDEEIAQAKNGSAEHIKKLIESARPFFNKEVHRGKACFCSGHEFDDYLSDINFKVWDALQKFDESRGCSFYSFLTNTIRWDIGRSNKKRKEGKFAMNLTTSSHLGSNNLGFDCDGSSLAHQTGAKAKETGLYSPTGNVCAISDLESIPSLIENFPSQEKFFIERMLGGDTIKEAVDASKVKFNVSGTWAYITRDKAINKLKKAFDCPNEFEINKIKA